MNIRNTLSSDTTHASATAAQTLMPRPNHPPPDSAPSVTPRTEDDSLRMLYYEEGNSMPCRCHQRLLIYSSSVQRHAEHRRIRLPLPCGIPFYAPALDYRAAFQLAAALSPHVTFNVTYYVAALVNVALKLVTVISDMCRAAPFQCLARLGVVTTASPRTLH
ncbi:hypothetical protein J6590_074934 [Homalodisca vitripennis]|nr:hypothetical protein J6590_074934 [Homalodisca vitripennis]